MLEAHGVRCRTVARAFPRPPPGLADGSQVVPDESACKQAKQAVGASSNPESRTPGIASLEMSAFPGQATVWMA